MARARSRNSGRSLPTLRPSVLELQGGQELLSCRRTGLRAMDFSALCIEDR